MDARKRVPHAAMAGAMMAFSGGSPLDAPTGRSRSGRSGGVCLWEGSPYNGSYHSGYSNQPSCKFEIFHYVDIYVYCMINL